MANAITPSLGIDFGAVYPAGTRPPVKPGTAVEGSDGHKYVLATASANVAPSTVVILTEPALTFAAGAGAFTSPPVAVTAGQNAWLLKTAI